MIKTIFEETEELKQIIKFILPYAKKAFDLEVNKYAEPIIAFYDINERVKAWEKNV